LVCKKCGEKKKVTKDLEDGIETKAKKITCPDCGAEITPIEGKEEAACPDCGTMVKVGEAPKPKEKEKEKEDTPETEEEKKLRLEKEKKEIEEKEKTKKKELNQEDNLIVHKRIFEGNPSIYDILNAVNKAFGSYIRNGSNLVPNEQDSRNAYVQDLYPINYPSGKAVIVKYSPSLSKEIRYAVDYIYKDGEATISNPVEVEEGYIKKSLDEFASIRTKEINESIVDEMQEENDYLVEKVKTYSIEIDRLKEFEDELLVIKEGRILSGKNRTLIKNCIDQMNESIEALGALMNATDISTKGIEDEEDLDGIFFEEEDDDILGEFTTKDIEEITKKAVSGLSLTNKIDMNAIVNRVESRIKGKVS
jgi:DNA-directed RNA polymerase subunit RPC12/RpoP